MGPRTDSGSLRWSSLSFSLSLSPPLSLSRLLSSDVTVSHFLSASLPSHRIGSNRIISHHTASHALIVLHCNIRPVFPHIHELHKRGQTPGIVSKFQGWLLGQGCCIRSTLSSILCVTRLPVNLISIPRGPCRSFLSRKSKPGFTDPPTSTRKEARNKQTEGVVRGKPSPSILFYSYLLCRTDASDILRYHRWTKLDCCELALHDKPAFSCLAHPDRADLSPFSWPTIRLVEARSKHVLLLLYLVHSTSEPSLVLPPPVSGFNGLERVARGSTLCHNCCFSRIESFIITYLPSQIPAQLLQSQSLKIYPKASVP